MSPDDALREPQVSRAGEPGAAGRPNGREPALPGTVRTYVALSDLEARARRLLFGSAKCGNWRVPDPEKFSPSDRQELAQAAIGAAGLLSVADEHERTRAARLAVRLIGFAPIAGRIAVRIADPVVVEAITHELAGLRNSYDARPRGEWFDALVSPLAEALRSSDFTTFQRAFGLLSELSAAEADISPVVPRLVEVLTDGDDDFRHRAAVMLRSLSRPDTLRPFAPQLMAALENEAAREESGRYSIVWILLDLVVFVLGAEFRELAVPAVLRIAKTAPPIPRSLYAEALGSLGGRKEGVAMLAELLFAAGESLCGDRLRSEVVRGNVARALKRLEPEGLDVIRHAESDPRPEVRAAVSCLREVCR